MLILPKSIFSHETFQLNSVLQAEKWASERKFLFGSRHRKDRYGNYTMAFILYTLGFWSYLLLWSERDIGDNRDQDLFLRVSS